MRGNRLVPWLLVLLAANAAGVGLFWLWELLAIHAVESGEVPVLTVVLWWKAGLAPYSHAGGIPLILNPYGPLFEWICASLPAPRALPYLSGRAISILAMLGIGATMVFWLRRRRVGWLPVMLALLLPVTAKPWILFGPLYRVDALAILLSVAGLSLVVLSRSRAALGAALAAFTLAVSVKLTALAAPVAAVIYLWTVQRGRALVLAAGAALLLPGSVLALQVVTDGAYLFNAGFGNEPTHWLKSVELASRTLLSLFWLLAVMLLLRRTGPSGAAEARAPAIYAATSLVLAAVFAANPLSSWNYLMEFYVALGLLSGELLARFDRGDAPHTSRATVLVLLVVHAALALGVSTATVWRTRNELLDYRESYLAAQARLAPLVREGRNVLVLDSLAGRDALNALGQPNAVSAPHSVERRPEIQHLIRRAVADGDLDLVLAGPTLEPWTGRSSPGPSTSSTR